MSLYKCSSRLWSLVVFPRLEAVVFSCDRFCTLRIEPLWRMFFARFIRGRNKNIYT